MLRIMCLLSFQEKTHKQVNNNTSVIAVPRATPKAGLSLKITRPNKIDNPAFNNAATKTENR